MVGRSPGQGVEVEDELLAVDDEMCIRDSAVIGLIKALAADLAGTGITANAVCPGSTRTAILDASAAVYGLDSAEEFAHQQLVERLLVPDEPAALIAWLCTPEASGVTGAALSVDGGLTTS